jgi:hypothetical protein
LTLNLPIDYYFNCVLQHLKVRAELLRPNLQSKVEREGKAMNFISHIQSSIAGVPGGLPFDFNPAAIASTPRAPSKIFQLIPGVSLFGHSGFSSVVCVRMVRGRNDASLQRGITHLSGRKGSLDGTDASNAWNRLTQ